VSFDRFAAQCGEAGVYTDDSYSGKGWNLQSHTGIPAMLARKSITRLSSQVQDKEVVTAESTTFPNVVIRELCLVVAYENVLMG
jgi:hypothetical protein